VLEYLIRRQNSGEGGNGGNAFATTSCRAEACSPSTNVHADTTATGAPQDEANCWSGYGSRRQSSDGTESIVFSSERIEQCIIGESWQSAVPSPRDTQVNRWSEHVEAQEQRRE
jgi:hypothetical protein